MPVLLVTRPAFHAQRLIAQLEADGFGVIHEPLLAITPLDNPLPTLDGSPVIVLTSASALAGLAAQRDEGARFLGQTCYCVGAQTASQARAFGFTDVVSANADGAALAKLVLEKVSLTTPILHICGVDSAPEPAQSFTTAGRPYVRWVVYHAQPAERLTPDCKARLAAGQIDAALFTSVRGAKVFVKLIQESSLESCCKGLTAVGLSEAVGQALAALPFKRIVTAPQPSEECLSRYVRLSLRAHPMSEQVEQEPQAAPVSAHGEVKPSAQMGQKVVLYVLVLILVAAVSYGAALQLPALLGAAQDSAVPTLVARLDEIEARTKRVEEGLAKVANAATSSETTTEVQPSLSNGAEIEQLKTGLAGLAGALGQLQVELEKSSKITNEDRLNTQSGFATVIAFFQMERQALGGKPFEKDRLTLRKLADSDQTLVDMLITLEPYAVHGVATPVKLVRDWREKATEAQAALRKASAQTWIDRVVVALEGLISIRSIAPKAGDSMTFAAITIDMEEGSLDAAIQKAKAMPQEVQNILQSWLDEAQARLHVENTLASMNEHLIARGATPAPTAALEQPNLDATTNPPSTPTGAVE